MDYRKIILDAASENDYFVKETQRSLILKCPSCGKDKLYFEKNQGNFICFSSQCGNKGLVVKLLSQIKGISYQEAQAEIYQPQRVRNSYSIQWEDETEAPNEDSLPVIDIPPFIVPISDTRSARGVEYLSGRGIDLNTAIKYGIMYNIIDERVVFVLYNANGQPVGYQGRAINQVSPALKMRNNQGFRKGQGFMFWNLSHNSRHLIISEGPVDAIKFDLCGGNVASLGKDLTAVQLNLIDRGGFDVVYWALDDDALDLVPKYARLITKQSMVIGVPDEARRRIIEGGKTKVDFGECTMDECVAAFKNAEPVAYKIF
jgi:DNA primase